MLFGLIVTVCVCVFLRVPCFVCGIYKGSQKKPTICGAGGGRHTQLHENMRWLVGREPRGGGPYPNVLLKRERYQDFLQGHGSGVCFSELGDLFWGWWEDLGGSAPRVR